MQYVQAFISNISFPTSLDEVYNYAHLFNMEMLLGCEYYNLLTDGNCIDFNDTIKYESRAVAWTAPKWCKYGDIVFFMHAKTAISKITALKTELLYNRHKYSCNSFWIMMNALTRARKIYDIYGGKIFAVGRINGTPEYYENGDEFQHWKSTVYAPVDQIFLLEKLIDIAEFSSEIMISRQSSITPIFGERFDFLKQLILKKNNIIEDYFKESVAQPVPLSNINDDNWLEIVNKYRRSFFLEIQFRTFYVDRILKFLGDNKTFFRECACYKSTNPTSFVDNVIKLNCKFLPVEVKLSVSSERDIIFQLSKYCHLEKLQLLRDKTVNSNIYNSNVLVIDTENIYIYNDNTKSLTRIIQLDEIKNTDDIIALRSKIIFLINDN